MRTKKSNRTLVAVFVTTLTAVPAVVWAGAHTWKVNEVFSDSTGTIQFVELREAFGGCCETGAPGHQVGSSSTGNAYTIPGPPLVQPTGFKTLLFATPAFAALPGAPTPDGTFPANFAPFFNKNGDGVSYVGFDTFNFGPVPTDGLHSLQRDLTTPCNSPTNYAGVTGTVNLNCSLRGDVNNSGIRDGDDISAFVRVKLGAPVGGDNAACAEYCTGTLDGDIQGFVNDLLS